MRLPYILMAAVSTLFVHQVPVTASVGGDIALTGAMSLGLLHFVGADQSVSVQTRLLRGDTIDERDEEERGFPDMAAVKNFVKEMLRTESFSALEKVDDLVSLNKISAAADEHLASVFKFAHDNNMSPDDLATHLKTIPKADKAISEKAVEMYSKYLEGLGKE
ncbi:hypothetical protein ON010_g16677 [Phytophthora cinnamomi]|nr:hypothetical protein ON010_g16677 [Phytophthora cinnamomi]